MTRKEAAGVIKFEKACVLRQDTPRCNRDCKKCDLLLPTEDVLTAYDMAIKALEQDIKHAYDSGLVNHGIPVKVVETGITYKNITECAKDISGDIKNIYSCLMGKRQTCNGYHFEEVN